MCLTWQQLGHEEAEEEEEDELFVDVREDIEDDDDDDDDGCYEDAREEHAGMRGSHASARVRVPSCSTEVKDWCFRRKENNLLPFHLFHFSSPVRSPSSIFSRCCFFTALHVFIFIPCSSLHPEHRLPLDGSLPTLLLSSPIKSCAACELTDFQSSKRTFQ